MVMRLLNSDKKATLVSDDVIKWIFWMALLAAAGFGVYKIVSGMIG